MKERPILFNAEMVLAILSGRKTQTRRVAKVDRLDQHPERPDLLFMTLKNGKQGWFNSQQDHPEHISKFCPLGQIGDRLWVRETFRLFDPADECDHLDSPCGCPSRGTPIYKATNDCMAGEKWTPSIHMPRWASRITLEITNIRVERLNDISQEDAEAEGVPCIDLGITGELCVAQFADIWESVYGADSWAANPWVWAVEFKVVEGGL